MFMLKESEKYLVLLLKQKKKLHLLITWDKEFNALNFCYLLINLVFVIFNFEFVYQMQKRRGEERN